MEIISRDKAISLGLKRYFTGEPCKRDHISERYVKNSVCIECLHPTSGTQNTPNPDRIEIERQKLAIRQAQMELKKREIEEREANRKLREESAAFKLQRESRILEQKAAVAARRHTKSEMVTVNVLSYDDDLTNNKALVLAFAQARCPDLVQADIATGRYGAADCIHIMRCFPEDKALILETTNAIYSANPTHLCRQEALRVHHANQRATELQAEIDARPKLKEESKYI